MNKRLEEINSRTEFVEWEKGDIRAVVKSEDYSYLEEQVERVRGWETINIELHNRHRKTRQQNKRYRNLLESIRYTNDIAKEIQKENPNIKVITPDDLLQRILRKVNKELEGE